MTDEQELRRWREALAERPTGPDVAPLTGVREQEPPWRWRTLVENLAPMSHSVLDLGAGGGQDLAALADDTFDLVLSRHESYDALEVARLLAPGGAFLTQQVGGDDLREIVDHFEIAPPFPEVTLTAFEHALTRAGLTIERSGAFHGTYEFDDVPSLLGHLRRAPWHAPADLDVDRHRRVLEDLRDRMRIRPLTATSSRFLILARAPGTPDAGRTDFAGRVRDDLEVPRV